MANFTQSEFDKLTVDDLQKNVFVLDSNGNVCMRVLMIGQNIINWGQIGGTLADQADINSLLTTIQNNISNLQTGKINVISINAANGVAGLDGTGKIPASLLPSFVDDVLEYTNLAGFPGTGETGKIYVDLTTNKTYRWSGSVYVEISPSPGSTDSLSEGTVNKYFTESRVLNTLLSGLSLASSAVIAASDSVLGALGKLQAQITLRALLTSNTFTGNQTINGANTLSVSSGGGSTPDAIDVGGGGLKIGQINGDAVIRSSFASKFFKFRNSSSVDKLTIAYDTGNLDSKGTGSFGGDNTASGQMFGVNGLNHVYFAWLVNLVRKAYIGFGSAAATQFDIKNEMTNGDINIMTNGTGKVRYNGTEIPTLGGNTFSGTQVFSGTGKILVVGDDSSIHDINVANAARWQGEQDATQMTLYLGTGGAGISGANGALDLLGYTPGAISSTIQEAIPSGVQLLTHFPSTTLIEYGTYDAIPTLTTSPQTVNSVTYTCTQTDNSFPTVNAFRNDGGTTSIATNIVGQNYNTVQMSAPMTSNKFWWQGSVDVTVTVEVSTNGSSWESVGTFFGSYYGGQVVNFSSGYRTFSWFRLNYTRGGGSSITIQEFDFQKCELKTAGSWLAKGTAGALANFSGFVVGPKNVGDVVKLGNIPGTIVSGFTGLTAGAMYYVSDTAGLISTSLGTVKFPVGKAIDANRIVLQKLETDKEKSIGQLNSTFPSLSFFHYGGPLWIDYPYAGPTSAVTVAFTGPKNITVTHPWLTAGGTLGVYRIDVDLPPGQYTATLNNTTYYVNLSN